MSWCVSYIIALHFNDKRRHYCDTKFSKSGKLVYILGKENIDAVSRQLIDTVSITNT